MYLINYDFHDLYALIVFFRNNPERFSAYEQGIKDIISYINTPHEGNGLNENNIRRILRTCYAEQDEALSWIAVDNRYTANLVIIKNNSYYQIITAILNEMIQFSNDTSRFYLLCDASHNIPLILTDSLSKKNKAINSMIKVYRNKYNNNFLKNELKEKV